MIFRGERRAADIVARPGNILHVCVARNVVVHHSFFIVAILNQLGIGRVGRQDPGGEVAVGRVKEQRIQQEVTNERPLERTVNTGIGAGG